MSQPIDLSGITKLALGTTGPAKIYATYSILKGNNTFFRQVSTIGTFTLFVMIPNVDKFEQT